MKLTDSLATRHRLFDEAQGLLRKTRDVFARYTDASAQEKNEERFSNVEGSISSKDLRMVVLGEFSRGKSSLLNALLHIEQLPTATEATTAINTFIYGLQEGEPSPYIYIKFMDGKLENLPIVNGDQDVLRRWGTELDLENKDPRNDVEYIELHTSHPLLNDGLVLIDTPGLGSMKTHHQAITRKAIDSAHIAIWVQSASQLGGNQSEWKFLKGTITKNFRKFLTVVNMWDLVLDPQDSQDKTLTLEKRSKNKMDKVRRVFRETLTNMDTEELQELTDDRNLIGVSAHWALHGTPDQRSKSGIEALSNRISEMVSDPEVVGEIIFKPVTSLKRMQEAFSDSLSKSLNDLNSDKTIDEQERELEKLNQDIKILELEKKNRIGETRDEHIRQQGVLMKAIRDEMVEPLRALKGVIDERITESYVEDLITGGKVQTIDLPDDLRAEYEDTLKQVDAAWTELQKEIQQSLEEARLSFKEGVNKHMAGVCSDFFTSAKLEMPELNVSCNVDMSVVEKFYEDQLQLESDIEEERSKVEDLEVEIDSLRGESMEMLEAREALRRAERRRDSLGNPPPPSIKQETYCSKEGGTYTNATYSTRDVPDYAPVERWEAQRRVVEEAVAFKEEAIDALMAKELERTGRRMNREAAQRRVKQEIQKKQRQLEKLEKDGRQEVEKLVQKSYQQLVRATSGRLEKIIGMFEKSGMKSVEDIFTSQLTYLEKSLEEQFMEPIKEKKASLNQAIEVRKKGEQEMAERREKLEGGINELQTLIGETEQFLQKSV